MSIIDPITWEIKIKTYEKKCLEKYKGDPEKLLEKCQNFWPVKILACILIPLAFITSILLYLKKVLIPLAFITGMTLYLKKERKKKQIKK